MSIAPKVTPAELRRLGIEVGELLDRHSDGLSREELQRLYAAPGGGASLGGLQRFCGDILNLKLTAQQIEGALALVKHRQVLIQGANGTGKDTLTAAWSLYEVFVLGSLVILTGPSERQVKEVMMRREIGRLWRAAKGKLPGERYEMAIRIPGYEEGGLLAFTATDPEKFVGHHSAGGRVFLASTEAQGIAPEIFEAMQRVQPSLLLATCNTTTPACAAYGFSRSPAWHAVRWSALDHENVVQRRVVIKGAVTFEWVESMRLEHGVGSRFWLHAVEAKWPETSESPLIRPEWWEAACSSERRIALEIQLAERWVPVTIGLDPAREGEDRTAMVVRQGPIIRELHRWRETSTVDNARRVEEHVRRMLSQYGGVASVVTDVIAVGGGIHDELRERLPKLTYWALTGSGARETRVRVEAFKSSWQAGDKERFRNRRAECYAALAKRFERGTIGVAADLTDAADLREELLHHQMIYGADDRVSIASKDDLRVTLGRSPDLADATMQAFAPDVPTGGKIARFG